jgi:hypothetical protein
MLHEIPVLANFLTFTVLKVTKRFIVIVLATDLPNADIVILYVPEPGLF